MMPHRIPYKRNISVALTSSSKLMIFSVWSQQVEDQIVDRWLGAHRVSRSYLSTSLIGLHLGTLHAAGDEIWCLVCFPRKAIVRGPSKVKFAAEREQSLASTSTGGEARKSLVDCPFCSLCCGCYGIHSGLLSSSPPEDDTFQERRSAQPIVAVQTSRNFASCPQAFHWL